MHCETLHTYKKALHFTRETRSIARSEKQGGRREKQEGIPGRRRSRVLSGTKGTQIQLTPMVASAAWDKWQSRRRQMLDRCVRQTLAQGSTEGQAAEGNQVRRRCRASLRKTMLRLGHGCAHCLERLRRLAQGPATGVRCGRESASTGFVQAECPRTAALTERTVRGKPGP